MSPSQRRVLLLLLPLLALCHSTMALDNGLAITPPMGWTTWCTEDYCGLFDWCNETEIRSIADAMSTNGMKELGYEYILLDDCWADYTRSSTGQIRGDPARFPSGMAALSQYVHSKGLKFGLYTCAGVKTCKYGRTGSGGHFESDAHTFASWEIDYVKMDWCGHPSTPAEEVYGNMSVALNGTGRPMLFSLCEWGEQNVWEWGAKVGNIWRTHKDHLPMWFGEQGTLNIIDSYRGLSKYAGPGGWNDPDFLMTLLPPFMSFVDSRTEYSFWALWSAPLMVATEIRSLSSTKSSILLNPEVIQVNQDPLGIAGDFVAADEKRGTEIWSKPMSGPNTTYVIILFNRQDLETHSVTVHWQQISQQWAENTRLNVRDLWERKDLGSFVGSFTASVGPHDVAMILVSPATAEDTKIRVNN